MLKDELLQDVMEYYSFRVLELKRKSNAPKELIEKLENTFIRLEYKYVNKTLDTDFWHIKARFEELLDKVRVY